MNVGSRRFHLSETNAFHPNRLEGGACSALFSIVRLVGPTLTRSSRSETLVETGILA